MTTKRYGVVTVRVLARRAEPSGRSPHYQILLDAYVQRAMSDPTCRLHAYGTRWGPEPGQPDAVFGFEPGNGVHDVHMNQGSGDEHRRDNAAWSDGGLIFHDARGDHWRAIFLAFQTQSWHTDDRGNDVFPAHAGRWGSAWDEWRERVETVSKPRRDT